ncbi:MAG: Wzz/FepE/Etk N-terminal domain-containing protein [Halioglobus sp.]
MNQPSKQAPVNEIDIFVVAAALWQRRWLIVAITLLSLVAAFAYIQLNPAIYRVEAMIVPPALADLESVSAVSVDAIVIAPAPAPSTLIRANQITLPTGQSSLTPQDALLRSLIQLESASIREEALQKFPAESFGNGSTNDFQVVIATPKKISASTEIKYAVVSFEHPDRVHARTVLEYLLSEANNNAIAALTEEIEYKLRARTISLENKLQQAMLLRAESDSPYLNEMVTDLRLDINVLKAYSGQDYSSLKMLALANPVELPNAPVKPKKTLIVALAIAGGLFLGVFLSLVLYSIAQRKSAL